MTDTAMYDHLLEVVQKRRTNRKFKSDPIPRGYIEKIIEAARLSPSGFHTQPWEFVAVTRKDVRDRIVAALDEHSPPLIDPNAPGMHPEPVFVMRRSLSSPYATGVPMSGCPAIRNRTAPGWSALFIRAWRVHSY